MIRVQGLRYAVGTFRLELSLEVDDGEYFVLLGPTGSGKTAFVECLAGLRKPQAGRIEIAGLDVTRLEPRARGVGYVPQDLALFTNRTVRGNLAFGPEVRGVPRAERESRVREIARLVGLETLLDRRIAGLSGGERQRVALARALAVRPAALILDEPVSALDEAARQTLCRELRRLQRTLRLTTIHISHNVEEAFSVADRAAVLHNGRVEQVGKMEELLRRPRNVFVAQFLRAENILPATVRGHDPGPRTRLDAAGLALSVPGRFEGAVTVVLRPEHLTVLRPGAAPEPGAAGVVTAPLLRAVDHGAYVRLELGGQPPLVAHVPPVASWGQQLSEGAQVTLVIRAENVHVLPERMVP